MTDTTEPGFDRGAAMLVAERLKEIAIDLDGIIAGHDCVKLAASMIHRDHPEWVTVEVRHAALMSESVDGWDVTIRRGSL